MNHHPHPSSLFYLLTVFISIKLSPLFADQRYIDCRQMINCGDFTNITYPFSGVNRPNHCGQPGLELECKDDVLEITIRSLKYRVLKIDSQEFTLTVARSDYWDTLCPTELRSTVLNFTLFDYGSGVKNITLYYGCSRFLASGPSVLAQQTCTINGTSVNLSPLPTTVNTATDCENTIILPVFESNAEALERSTMTLRNVLREGFSMEWRVGRERCDSCVSSGGACGYNSTTSELACICSDGVIATSCSSSTGKKSNIRTIAAGISACLAGLILVFIAVNCWLRKKPSSLRAFIYRGKDKKNCQKLEEFVKTFGSTLPRRYSYSDIKKMTKSLMEKLGEGGYGSVYKGKLSDGRFVAVKVLSESKSDGEDFINEVASISRTSHINVVSLIGFCLEDTRKALIYEFMPNGSLDKLIYNERLLEWEKLFQIAVGIARGLEYLHRGCNTRILHFDIKPQNILLDGDWCPKISDFGLAKLCKRKESIVSMKGARGTAGYMAPEMFSRYFGGVSHKSDVYSYGMMVFEMVGGRKNLKLDVSKTSELYFPFWVYKHLEVGEDFNIDDILNEEQEEITKKMILVSFWCIQTNPMDRPSMSKVVDMLQGSLQSIKTPPKPVLYSPTRSPYSPTRSPLDYSTISSP